MKRPLILESGDVLPRKPTNPVSMLKHSPNIFFLKKDTNVWISIVGKRDTNIKVASIQADFFPSYLRVDPWVTDRVVLLPLWKSVAGFLMHNLGSREKNNYFNTPPHSR